MALRVTVDVSFSYVLRSLPVGLGLRGTVDVSFSFVLCSLPVGLTLRGTEMSPLVLFDGVYL